MTTAMNTFHVKVLIALLALLSTFCLFVVEPAVAFNLSADIITIEGASRQTGKLYVKGNKYRVDLDGASEYAIIRHDKNAAWMVLPDRKTYIEMPFNPKARPAIEDKSAGKLKRRLIGSDTVDGHPAKKYEVTAPKEDNMESFYQWITLEHDFPIKTVGAAGEWSIEYRNIKTFVPDVTFEIPHGYEKVSFESLSSSGISKLP